MDHMPTLSFLTRCHCVSVCQSVRPSVCHKSQFY